MAKFPSLEDFSKQAAEKILDEYEYEGKTIREWVNYIVNNDVVEVCRCKDCEYYEEAKVNELGFLICRASGMEITDEDFCSYGERRADDDFEAKTS